MVHNVQSSAWHTANHHELAGGRDQACAVLAGELQRYSSSGLQLVTKTLLAFLTCIQRQLNQRDLSNKVDSG